MKAIGIEGYWPPDVLVTWGPAALRLAKNSIVNSITRATTDRKTWLALVRGGHATELPAGLKIREAYHDSRILVVGIRRTLEGGSLLTVDPGRVGGLVAHHHTNELSFYAFADEEAFTYYASERVREVTARILKVGSATQECAALLRAGLILSPLTPELHALRVHFAPHPTRAEETSRTLLRESGKLEDFEKMLRALRVKPDQRYWLVYEGGIAHGGGLDTNVAAEQLSALTSVHKHLRPVLTRLYPFLAANDTPAAYRLQEMQAASAHLGFSVAVEGETLAQQVARYFELSLLQDLLNGLVPEDVANDAQLSASLERVCHPSIETVVRHKRLESNDTEKVAYSKPPVEDMTFERAITTVCGIEGIFRRLRKVELRFTARTTETVSTEDDGYGAVPKGAELFAGSAGYFFKPVVVRLNRFRGEAKVKYHIGEMQLLEIGKMRWVEAVPSVLIPGGYFIGGRLAVERLSETRWRLGSTELPSLDDPGVSELEAWLSIATAVYAEHELEHGLDARASWLRPAKPASPTALLRILIALGRAQGGVLIPDLITAVYRLGRNQVRKNNTRREIAANPELVDFAETDPDVVRATEKGKRMAQIFLRACPEFAGSHE